MSEIDLTLLNPALDKYVQLGRTALLPVLHATQDLYGYIPEQAAQAISQALKVPLSDVYGVVDFYALFYHEPISKVVVHVCSDPVCAMAGSEGFFKLATQRSELQRLGGQYSSQITVERAPCLGLCEHAPALLVQGAPVGEADSQTWEELVAGKSRRPRSITGGDIRVLTANCGRGRAATLSEYIESGGYQGLKKALALGPQAVIQEVKASGLVGRGGAAFPTGLKWESTAGAPGETRYIVCNADEAEPGTFKDRVMMEDDPHRILEGIIIAAFAIGAHKGYMYIRGEYNVPFQSMQTALEEATQAGWLGKNIADSSFSFDLELRQGAGAYVCGEETALFESIEGKRGLPRVKPPFPTTYGLFGKPTVINNVETLSNVPLILTLGAQAYRQMGTEKSPGPKLFCMSGDVKRPGLYEIPFGVTFRHLLEDLAGGVRPGHKFQAALFGGAAGAFATEKDLEVKLSFEDLKSAGLPLGSGVITIFDETRDLRDVMLRLARFFAEESCGKCYPCQIGTQRQYEIVQRVAAGQAYPGDVARLLDIGSTMSDASICGLGQAASSAVLSGLKHWPDLFQSSQIR
jgi:NADH-quinone oxidoreductase subunit F